MNREEGRQVEEGEVEVEALASLTFSKLRPICVGIVNLISIADSQGTRIVLEKDPKLRIQCIRGVESYHWCK